MSLDQLLVRLAPIPDPLPDADRRILFAMLDLEEAQEVRLRAQPVAEAVGILTQAQRACGDLRGLLLGLPNDVLDRVPREGEWSLRDTLRHIIGVELSYRAGISYAVARREDEPVAVPSDRRTAPDPARIAGSMGDLVAYLSEERAQSDRELANLDAAALQRPSRYANRDVDVRYRLYRLAAHVIEHTIQCETTLEALGVAAGDARRTVRRISAARGAHEHLSPPDVIAALDANQAAVAAAFGGAHGV